MDFNFSDEQVQLADAVARWADKAYPFDRRVATSKAGGFSDDAYQEMAALGLCGLVTDSDFDGMDMGPVEAMVVMEKLGAALVVEPIALTWMASATLQQFASSALKTQWLPALASGEKRLAIALNERGGRYRVSVCTTQATSAQGAGAEAGSATLTGSKHVVLGGGSAHAFIVNAQLDGQPSLFIVARDAAGVRCEAYGTQDGGNAAELQLDNAPAQLLTTSGAEASALIEAMGIAFLAAEAVGVMEKTLAMTVDYMNTRQQFRSAIASFQALRHKVADVKMALELARSMSYYATLKLNAPAAERRQAISRAKVQLGESMRFVGQTCVQLHGGIGVTDEYAVSHYFKRLTQMEMTYGDTLHHLGVVSDTMDETAGVFA